MNCEEPCQWWPIWVVPHGYATPPCKPPTSDVYKRQLLLQTKLDKEQRDYAAQIERSSEHMLAIVNDILDISKIETGHLALDVTDFDLPGTIKETCSAATALARAKGLRLDLQIDSDVPTRMRGDGRRLQQVLANLLANAVKFTSAGTVAVHVSATPTLRDRTEVHVIVADKMCIRDRRQRATRDRDGRPQPGPRLQCRRTVRRLSLIHI